MLHFKCEAMRRASTLAPDGLETTRDVLLTQNLSGTNPIRHVSPKRPGSLLVSINNACAIPAISMPQGLGRHSPLVLVSLLRGNDDASATSSRASPARYLGEAGDDGHNAEEVGIAKECVRNGKNSKRSVRSGARISAS